VRLFKDFYNLLATDGTVEIRVPDVGCIIKPWQISLDKKITLLFGGQDIPQGIDQDMDKSRKRHPHLFCHKYGWTMDSMQRELYHIGFSKVICKRAETNFITYVTK